MTWVIALETHTEEVGPPTILLIDLEGTIAWVPHLNLSWTFCLISTSIAEVMSLSKYSDNCSVACSRSLWLSCNISN